MRFLPLSCVKMTSVHINDKFITLSDVHITNLGILGQMQKADSWSWALKSKDFHHNLIKIRQIADFVKLKRIITFDRVFKFISDFLHTLWCLTTVDQERLH